MSIDSNQTQLGKSFTYDLQEIRKRKNLSLIDLHRTTRIPLEVLSAFEYNGLVDRPNYHMVYLRSLVREYARQLELDEEVALESLEAFKMGSYKGQLAHHYLNLNTRDLEKPRVNDREKVVPIPIAPPRQDSEPDQDERDEASIKPLISTVSKEPYVKSGVPQSTKSTRLHRTNSPRNQTGLFIGLSVIGLIAIGALLWFFLGRGTDPTVESSENIVPVLPQADSRDRVEDQPVIGDSMLVTIIAARGTLSPIQVSVDSALAIPYWVEEGDSIEFNVARLIELRNWIQNADLKIQREPWLRGQQTQGNSILITRDDAVRYLDSLRFSTN